MIIRNFLFLYIENIMSLQPHIIIPEYPQPFIIQAILYLRLNISMLWLLVVKILQFPYYLRNLLVIFY